MILSISVNVLKNRLELMERGDDEAMFIDYDFLRALGIWHAAYFGYWFWYRPAVHAADQPAFIQDVLLFPQMRPEKTVE